MPDETLKSLRNVLSRGPCDTLERPCGCRTTSTPDTQRSFATGEHAQAALAVGVDLLRDLQPKLAAQERFALVVILQGMDAAGKDSTIQHVMSGLNPQGVTVHSFKVPSAEELLHDYLWRYARELPSRGMIGICQ